MTRILLVATMVCMTAGLGLPALAQTVSSDSLVESLKPKTTATRSLTRSLAKPVASADEQFLEALPTRGIRIELRQKLDEIVDRQDLPRVDIEIGFDFDSAQIRQSSIPDVDELGKALSSAALNGSRFALNGHTDASGSDEYNQSLSERRAAAVRAYLIEKFAIDNDRLIAIGYGEERLKNGTDPLAPENRRVEVINLTKG
jgi:outer membrane protein OmpA-like peptidoglycan-associated protein